MSEWHKRQVAIQPTLNKLTVAIGDRITIQNGLRIIQEIAPTWGVFPNPNEDYTHCQFCLTPPNGFTCSVTVRLDLEAKAVTK